MERINKLIIAFVGILALVGQANLAVAASRGAPATIFPKLHMLNLDEVKAGNLGAAKACRPDVRLYGQHLAMDHKLADANLMALARQRLIPLNRVALEPWEMNNVRNQEAAMRRLRAMRGCQFDHFYLMAMRDAHAFAIRMVTLSLYDRTSLPIRPMLTRTLTSLRQHHARALQLLSH